MKGTVLRCPREPSVVGEQSVVPAALGPIVAACAALKRRAIVSRPLRGLMVVVILFTANVWAQQLAGDQLGAHDMSPGGTSMVRGPVSSACLYCHAPHGGMASPTPLWNQQLSIQTYQMYTSSTYHQTGVQPVVGSPSKMCLSCHDGTVAPGQTLAYGTMNVGGTLRQTAKFGADLRSSHPFSLQTPLTNAPGMNAQLFTMPPRTGDTAVPLVNGTVECTSCHQPHAQAIDKIVQKFLVRDNSNGALCLACHDPTVVGGGQANPLQGWTTSVHATASHTTVNNPYVGGYGTVAQNACDSCHMPHNAAGAARLLRGPDQQDCTTCHGGSNMQPAIANVLEQMSSSSGVTRVGHPIPDANNPHDPTEGAVLNNNRHATCVDCHNPHAAQQSTSLGVPPAIRGAQTVVVGVSSVDGITNVTPAVNQYENCFRCHGTSAGKGSATVNFGYAPLRAVKGADPLNIIDQFAATAVSSHPVTHDRSSALPQTSLRTQMLNLDGSTPGRSVGTRIFCTDCHNADNNREFGGEGANGPHGSKYSHILERRYEMSQAATPGTAITNPLSSPDMTVNGPYALCAKCHDLSLVLSSTVFNHQKHVVETGASCSVCHAAHGVGAQSAAIGGERLINFDVGVVAPLGANPISFNAATKSCTLTCHGAAHDNKSY